MDFKILKEQSKQQRKKQKVNNVRINNSNYDELKELSIMENVSITKLVNYMISESLKILRRE